MECTKCKKKLELNLFSYKDIENKIFYLYCDICRNKKDNIKKKQYEKNSYNEKKELSVIKCICGKSYIAFRDYHIIRHENSVCHIKKCNKILNV
jgi:hypothetical protein